MAILFRRLLIAALLLLSLNAFAGWTVLIGDIEGLPKRWQKLINDGVISISPAGEVTLRDGYSLIFLGDLMKRGPYGVATIDRLCHTADEVQSRQSTSPQYPRSRESRSQHAFPPSVDATYEVGPRE